MTKGQDPAEVITGGKAVRFERVAPEWHGTRKIWKVDYDGSLRDCTEDEMRYAQTRVRAVA